MILRIWTVLLFALLCATAIAWFIALMREKSLRPVRELAAFLKRHSLFGRVILCAFFIGMCVYGSTKSGNGGGGDDGGGTNSLQMVVGSGDGLQPLDSPETVADEWTDFTPITSPNTSRTLDGDDFRRGFVLTRVGMDEAFDFSAPADAAVCGDWRAFGAAEDWIYLAFGDWAFRLGTNEVGRFRVHSDGWTEMPGGPRLSRPEGRGRDKRVLPAFWPFRASLGIGPEANWPMLGDGEQGTGSYQLPTTNYQLKSLFWHLVTPSNTLQLTWQNVLLDRATSTPVNVQMEVWSSGRFTYRYDLSRLDVEEMTNALVGACFGGLEWATNSIPTNLTSLAFHPLLPEDAADPDRDGDGLSLLDELFAFGTDPELWDTDHDGLSDGKEVALGTDPLRRDTDGDGLVDGSDPDPLVHTPMDDLDGDGVPDAYEDFWFGGTNAFDTAAERDGTGFTLAGKMLCGINPTNSVAAANVVSTNGLVTWRLFDGFVADWPAGMTNLVWERTFTVNRSSAWQQFFVSASPTNAAGWRLTGMALEWDAGDGACGPVPASPLGDSFRIPLSTNDCPYELTLRLRATGAHSVCSPEALHFIAYAPEFHIEGGDEITGQSGTKFHVFLDGTDSQIDLAIDHSLRPCRAAMGADECDMEALSYLSGVDGDFTFSGDAYGGSVIARRPGVCPLPDIGVGAGQSVPLRSPRLMRRGGGGGGTIVVLDPSASWCCSGHGCYDDGVGYDWGGYGYYEEDDYPLDSKCLREGWYHDWGGGWIDGDCELRASSGAGDGGGCVTTSGGSVYVDGVEVWSGSPEHVYDVQCGGSGGGYGGCESCASDCADGNCDALEGSSLGSLKFRIPLGAPVTKQVSGFVWFATEEPIFIGKDTFQLLGHPSATISDTTASGVRRIVCSDQRGRDLRIEDIANGVQITIYDTAAQTLEHTWQVFNVNGDPSRVRLRKISRLNNVMSDETYTYSHSDGNWTRFDNIAGIGTQLTAYNDLNAGGSKWETRTTTDGAGNILESVTTEMSLVGEFDNAVLRETYRSESTGLGTEWTETDYWNDPPNFARHGKPRLVLGNARAWTYSDYDEDGHLTLRIAQLGNAAVPSGFPYVISNVLYDASVLTDAFVTVWDFAPLDGDSCHEDDAARPRTETRHVVRDGAATLIGRTWTRYTRLTRDGYAAIRKETWRAGKQSAEIGDPANAYSYEITYADTGEGTPLLMRNAAAESLDEDGVLTVNTYSLSGDVLFRESRKSRSSHAFPTYETTEMDASYGTVLRRTVRLTDGDTIIEDEQSIYDSQNRLRSTIYLDGTSLTNAYSCCRLLWRRDREGRKVLRSAQTGTDHLYNAMEDVWLADLSTNGQYRVTQHFYDALGRETNTVVYAGTTPGEAVVATAPPPSRLLSVSSTAYPYGGDDYAVSTDERGKVTVRSICILGDSIETCETVLTNGVEVVKTKSRSYFGGGSSTRREWCAQGFGPYAGGSPSSATAWTEERRFTDYAADGKRIDYVVTSSYDKGTVTNSVSTYDLLGRLISTSELGANGSVKTTICAYCGTTSRILSATFTAGDVARTTTYLYNDFGEQVGTVLDGVTNRTDVTYAEVSNEWWRVETSSVIGPHTNSLTIAKTQLTGLSDAIRRHEVTMVGCAGQNAPQTVTETTASFNPATGIETETTSSSVASSAVRQSLCGLILTNETSGTTTINTYDAFARVAATFRAIGEGMPLPLQSFDYSAAGDLLATHTYTNSGEVVSESYAYDTLGNRVATTDALGITIFKSYDAAGNVIAEDGATYPVRYTHDTQNRRTSLSTTRDGETWDTTSWAYDAATGNCLSKTYADNSIVIYTYTPDNLPLRTTYASGRWKENMYDSRRQIVAVEYSDGEIASFDHDAFLNEIAFSNDVASANLDRDLKGNCTNDTAAVGNESKTITRTFDAFSRLNGIDDTIYDYNADGLLASISNMIAVVDYAYTQDRLDAGYSLTLSNGVVFSRSLLHDVYRRSLVTDISSVANGVGVGSLAYTYDALNRPTARNNDTFGYNARSEVTAANVSGVPAAYGYDEIGNSTNWTANCLNQYAEFMHDADGNMTQCGDWAYTYDAANRLKTVSSNGVLLVTNFYDAKSRRVKKVSPEATITFFYDGWNLIEERIASTNGISSTIHYYWGKDLSGTLQGAGGVGGLLYLTIDGVPFVPSYDNIGNITRYLDANGNTVAQYTYDAFGNTLSQSGTMCGVFRHRFSTKHFDAETGFYYYGYRFYFPPLTRWLNRDPIEEEGGVNLYGFCQNSMPYKVDFLGKIECCNCVYSGNLLTSGQSTGFSILDRKKCFYLSEGWIIDVIEDYLCVPKFHSAIGNCFAKSCRVTTRYRCQKSQSTSDPTKYAYFWAYISDEVQPCATRSR